MMDFPSITLIDFNDSFTYNIVSEIYGMGEKVRVIGLEDALCFLEEFSSKRKNKHVLIYGPGPGHPHDYNFLFPSIVKLLQLPSVFHFGICLGHQILWSIKGVSIRRSCPPLHGQRVLWQIPRWPGFFSTAWMGKRIHVQRYNSLCLDLQAGNTAEVEDIHKYPQGTRFSFANGECMAGHFPNGLTYQFHPESIGTSYPKVFFAPIVKFLYNENDGKDVLKN